ncbi:protein phosphatase regulator [Sporothrix eucalyptigena]|uniref:Protein phosphatase regulator n=1 Tax=Sporothrix eucalyptigena TaxID=1812306 RepID=A0ABP0AS85_9PEZI
MAVVITSDEAAHFAPGIRRSHSQPKFSSNKTGFRQSASASKISDVYRQQQHAPLQHQPSPPTQSQAQQSSPEPYQQIPVFSDSSNSSAASSPRANATGDAAIATSSPSKLLVPSLRLPGRLGRPGYGSSPNGTDDGTEGDVAIDYPHYDGVSYFNPDKEYDPPSPRTASPNDNNTVSSTGPSRTDSSDQFDLFEHVAEDDTAVRAMPSRHVDYLSHNWKEEDIWESWKYIVSRRGDYSNSARLENASWRTWMKSKNKLKTVSPETLNWLKDCDVTWLYGPLQTGHTMAPGQVNDSVELTKSNSFLASHKKPILKKRSMSEIMLQRSLSASSLIKQAAAAVQAQQKDSGARRMSRPRLERATTDYVTFPFSSRGYSTGPSSMLPSTSSSGIVSPSTERRHIHFNEQVEQCIAVEVKGDDDDDSIMAARYNYDSDSDDGAIMMKRTISKPRMQRRRSSHNHNESKTIAMLPSTTLKYREDTPDLPCTGSTGSAMKHSYRSPILSPSSSQETLRPSKASGKFLIDDEDEDEEDEEVNQEQYVVQQPENDDDDDDDDSDSDSDDDNFGMSMGASKRRTGGLLSSASTSRLGGHSIDSALHASSMFDNGLSGSSSSGGGGLKRTTSTNSLSAEPSGMRRTASGMFMPYDEGEPAGGGNGGLLGRVIDTVNTARDIVHVIWNVGWNS